MRVVALTLSNAVGIREVLLVGLATDILADSLHVELRLPHLERLGNFNCIVLWLNVKLGVLIVLEKLDDLHFFLGLVVRLESAVWLIDNGLWIHISESLLLVVLL